MASTDSYAPPSASSEREGSFDNQNPLSLDPRTVASHFSEYTYTLLEKLGEGGFGQAWAALRENDEGIADRVCLKFVEDQGSWHTEAYFGTLMKDDKRFVQILETFPHAVASGRQSKTWFVIVSEEMKNGNLASFLAKTGSWSEARAIKEIKGLLKSMSRLHAQGIMHLDITPGNILVSESGHLKFADMGIAVQRLWGRPAKDIAFNPGFVSLTRRDGELRSADPRDDIDQMGRILLMLLLGDASSRPSLTQLRALTCSARTKALIRKACGRRSGRFADAVEMHAALTKEVPEMGEKPTTLAGKRVVITGRLEKIDRTEAETRLCQARGILGQEVTSQTNVLVVGGVSPHYSNGAIGRKISAAKKLNKTGARIQIIGESEFLRLTKRQKANR